MYPWGHFAVGYICYSLAVRFRYHRPPEGVAVVALAFGTQLPDLIDKPLSWTFGFLPSGRSLGHSLLFAIILGIVAWYAGQRFDRQTEAGAFASGHLLHVLTDFSPAVIDGQWSKLGSLLWPVIPAYQYPGETDRSIIGYLSSVDVESLPTEGILLAVLTTALLLFDEMPKIKTVAKYIKNFYVV
jgi:hypothetical protein